MKIFLSILVFVATSLTLSQAHARDTKHLISIDEALATPEAKAKLDPKIKFVFGSKNKIEVAKHLGDYMSNKKTNAFNKGDKEACEWAFLSAMLSLQKRAQDMGGDAVVNITSFYKKNDHDSKETFECGAGAFVAGVTLKGEVVKLK